MGLHDVKQFTNNRGDSAKMTRARFAAEHFRERRLFNESRVAARIHFFGRWREKKIDTIFAAELRVGCEGARVARQIFGRAELRRVHKNADDNKPVWPRHSARTTDQRE